jgi:enoyl-CoA hydratase/carnithine racemase
VATLNLNQPEIRNAQNPVTWNSILAAVNALPGTVRLLLLCGEGSSFSAGLDRRMLGPDGIEGAPNLMELASMPAEDAEREIAGYQEAFGVFARPGLVSIALVQGHAVGAGFQLALACDLRIAAEDAQFTMAEVKLGLVPDLGGTKRLIELVGYSRAAGICLTGRPVPAAEALSIGLVTEVVRGGDLAKTGDAYVEQLLALPWEAVSEIKALLLAAAGRPQHEQEGAERAAQYRRLRAMTGLEREA